MPRRSLLWILAITTVSLIALKSAQSAGDQEKDYAYYKVFVDAFEHVRRSYVRDVKPRKLLEGALQGMLASLDPYSSYITPDNLRYFDRSTKGHFGGVGIQITLDRGRLTVISPLAGTPAYQQGVQAGDWIMKIEGKKTDNITLDQAVKKLTGKPGTDVTITVLHRGDTKPVDITIQRAVIKIKSILGDSRTKDDSWDFMYDKEHKIGYIRLTSFTKDTARDLRAALEELKQEGVRGLILDLRYNPGGLLRAATEVSDLFLSGGVIVSTRGRNAKPRTYPAKGNPPFGDIPMAILVNKYSASASEIVAAAIQDHKRGIIVGTRTWGKGSVQNVIELEGGRSALKLTTATYWRPSGKNIHRHTDDKETDDWGVRPDTGMKVDLTIDEMRKLIEQRRDRDVIPNHKADPKAGAKAAPKTAPTPAGGKAEEGKKDEPVVDRQLQRAMHYLLSVMAYQRLSAA